MISSLDRGLRCALVSATGLFYVLTIPERRWYDAGMSEHDDVKVSFMCPRDLAEWVRDEAKRLRYPQAAIFRDALKLLRARDDRREK